MAGEQLTIYDAIAEQEKESDRTVTRTKRLKARTQEDKVIEYIKRYGSITQRDAFEMGISRLAARVYDINNGTDDKYRGVHIVMDMDEALNQDGELVRFGRYRMA